MNLIKDRDARTKKRQKAKNKFDRNITLADAPEFDSKSICTLALNRSEGTVRLLDEGAIVTASGNLDLYIKKGTIKKYVSGKNKELTLRSIYGDYAEKWFDGNVDEPMNLDDKYEGTINIGHNDFATFPVGIVGTWKQSDLHIVDNGDGRKGLDVDLKLNEAHPLVQALRVQGIPVGVSVEMYLHFDEKATEEQTDKRKAFTPIVDEIFIGDFAIVGECGNVGSSGSVDLQGVNMEDSVKDTESMEEATLEETAEENEMPEGVEDTVEDTPTDAPTDAPTDEPTAEEPEDEEPEEDETVEEETDDEADGEEVGDEEDALSVAMETIETLTTEITSLKEQVEALKKSNAKKDKKIKENAEREAEFAKKFKGLNVSLGVTKEQKKEVVTKLYATGDGIGE